MEIVGLPVRKSHIQINIVDFVELIYLVGVIPPTMLQFQKMFPNAMICLKTIVVHARFIETQKLPGWQKVHSQFLDILYPSVKLTVISRQNNFLGPLVTISVQTQMETKQIQVKRHLVKTQIVANINQIAELVKPVTCFSNVYKLMSINRNG